MRPGREADPSTPFSAEVKNKSRAIPLLSLRAFVAYERVKPTVILRYGISVVVLQNVIEENISRECKLLL